VAASNAQICRLFIGTIELGPTMLVYLPGEIQRLYLSSGFVTNYKAGFARAPFRANFDFVDLGNVFHIHQQIEIAAMFAELNDDVGAAGEDAGLITFVIQERDRLS